MRMIIPVLIAAAHLAFPGVASAQRSEEPHRSPMPSHLPLKTDACFGRTYDAAHLKRNPRQRVTSFHLLRDFTPDKTTEFEPQTVDELKTEDGRYGTVSVTALVRFRDRKPTYWNILSCSSGERGVVCGVDCDGGSFALKPLPKADGLLLDNGGFVVLGGCGADDDEENVNVSPGADDKTFRLDRQPLATCLALRDAVRPAWAKLGPPLRERLDRKDAVCFSRSYDAAHLSKHPKQTVRRFAVLKNEGDVGGEGASHVLSFRVEMKDGRKIEKRAKCYTESYAYICTPEQPTDAEASFYFTRAGDKTAMVRDRKGRLTKLFGVKLGDDDRMFRLEAAPPQSCAF